MKEKFNIKSSDGLNLVLKLNAVENPQILVLLVHGMGEHKGRYQHVIEFFNQHRIAVLSIDLRGHGESEGQRGHTPSFHHLMQDLNLFIEFANQLFPSIKKVLYAHSMGGNLALNYLCLFPNNIFSAAIVTSPYIRLAFDPPKWKIILGNIAAKIYPKLSQKTGLDENAISRNKDVIHKYMNDSLVHDRITASFFKHVHQAGETLLLNSKQIQTPLLLMHGTGDRITSYKASIALNEALINDHTLKLWPNFYHELHNEPEQQEVFDYVIQWLIDKDLLLKL